MEPNLHKVNSSSSFFLFFVYIESSLPLTSYLLAQVTHRSLSAKRRHQCQDIAIPCDPPDWLMKGQIAQGRAINHGCSVLCCADAGLSHDALPLLAQCHSVNNLYWFVLV